MTPQTTMPHAVNGPLRQERKNRTLAELAAEQGLSGPQCFDSLFGAGADSWDTDAEFEEFLANLH